MMPLAAPDASNDHTTEPHRVTGRTESARDDTGATLPTLDAELRVEELLAGFAGDAPSAPDVESGLRVFCERAGRLLQGRRTSVWLFDRRAREIVLRAASDPDHTGLGHQISVAADEAPAARLVRETEPYRAWLGPPLSTGSTEVIAVPLRGRRRALGVLIVEDTGTSAAADPKLQVLVSWLGRQLAGAIENAQLFAGVLQSRRELEHTFNSIADLVAVFDRRLAVVEVNQALASRLGHSVADLRERPLRDVVGAEAHGWIAGLAASPSPDGAPASTRQFEDDRWDGIFSVAVSNRRDRHGEIIGGVLVARDITEDARLEAERDSLRERLTQAEKLAALGQFVAGIAHELNNPLQGVMGHIELVQRTKELSRPSAKDLRTAFREADRAAKIVRNLPVFTGSQRTPRRRVSVNAVITRALANRAAALEALGVEVVRQLDPRLPRVRGDAPLLHQAFLNILTNAEHAMDGADLRRLEVRTSVSESGSEVVAYVSDTGPGIPADVLPRIFEPFYTTKEVGKGTGLGLAIAYGIVKDHGGQIYPKNEQVGTSFTVKMPVDNSGVANGVKGR